MSIRIEKITPWLLYAFVFLLPWQTRWIWHQGLLAGGHWEYGAFSLYGVDILLIVLFLLSLFLPQKQTRGVERFWVLIGSFFLVCFASIFWSQNKELGWYAAAKLGEGILLFWLVIRLPLNWRAIGAAFVSSGVVQAVFGIYQFFSQHIVASKWFGLSAHDPGTLGDFVVETSSGRWLRAYGSLPHPNMLAGFLVVCLLLLIGFILMEQRRLLSVIMHSAAFAIIFFGLVLTFSRAAWLALAAVFAVLVAIAVWRRHRYRLFVLTRIGAWIFLLTIFSFVMLPNLWQTRVVDTGRLEAISSQQRVSYYKEAWSAIKQDWAQGTGIGNYTQALYNQNSLRQSWDYQPVHNIFVLVTAEVGVFGGLIFVLLAFEFVRSSFTVIKKKVANVNDWFLVYTMIFFAFLIIGLFDHYLWTLSFGILLFWLMLGLWVRGWLEGNHEGFIHALVDKLFRRQS